MIQQPPSGVPREVRSRVCTMLVIGSALQAAACRGRGSTPSRGGSAAAAHSAPVDGLRPVDRPLHVLRALVVLLRPPGQPGHGRDLVVGEAGNGLPFASTSTAVTVSAAVSRYSSSNLGQKPL